MIIKNLIFKRGKKKILNGLDFKINNKIALVGPNGSGKTTTLNIKTEQRRSNC